MLLWAKAHRNAVTAQNKEASAKRKAYAVFRNPGTRAAPLALGTLGVHSGNPQRAKTDGKIKLRQPLSRVKLASMEDAVKYKPPNTYFHDINEMPKRFRVFYQVGGGKRLSTRQIIENEEQWKDAILHCLRFAWNLHLSGKDEQWSQGSA